MIQSFRCEATHELFVSRRSRLWSNVQMVALRKLDQIDAANDLKDLFSPPGTTSNCFAEHGQVNTASGSTANGESVSSGSRMERTTWRLWTTID
jgi:hypothetical protein